MKSLILGVDAGTKAAIAMLDLNGCLVKIISSKEMGLEKIISEITKYGKPIIIASDVSKAPYIVEKLAQRFSAKLVLPKNDLKVEEKKKIIERFFEKRGFRYYFDDPHQQDAYASAVLAFNRYSKLFSKVEKILKGKNMEGRMLEIKEKIVSSKDFYSIQDLITEEKKVVLVPRKKREPKMVEENPEKRIRREYKEIKELYDMLKKENSILKEKIKSLEMRQQYCGSEKLKKLAELRKETILFLERKIKLQEKEIEALKQELLKSKGMKVEDIENLVKNYREKRAKLFL